MSRKLTIECHYRECGAGGALAVVRDAQGRRIMRTEIHALGTPAFQRFVLKADPTTHTLVKHLMDALVQRQEIPARPRGATRAQWAREAGVSVVVHPMQTSRAFQRAVRAALRTIP